MKIRVKRYISEIIKKEDDVFVPSLKSLLDFIDETKREEFHTSIYSRFSGAIIGCYCDKEHLVDLLKRNFSRDKIKNGVLITLGRLTLLKNHNVAITSNKQNEIFAVAITKENLNIVGEITF